MLMLLCQISSCWDIVLPLYIRLDKTSVSTGIRRAGILTKNIFLPSPSMSSQKVSNIVENTFFAVKHFCSFAAVSHSLSLSCSRSWCEFVATAIVRAFELVTCGSLCSSFSSAPPSSPARPQHRSGSGSGLSSGGALSFGGGPLLQLHLLLTRPIFLLLSLHPPSQLFPLVRISLDKRNENQKNKK